MNGKDLAKAVPPPDKLKKGGGDPMEPDADDAGDDEAAEMSLMEAFAGAVKDGTPEEQLAAFKDLLAACKY